MRDPLSRAVELGRNTLPVADIGAGQSLLAQQCESSARLEQPERHRGRPERLKHLRRQHGGELGAIGSQFGARLDEEQAPPRRAVEPDVRRTIAWRSGGVGGRGIGPRGIGGRGIGGRGIGRRVVGQRPGQDRGGHLSRRYPGRGG